ncbi:unnamed protein product [Clavelina lepadiformis]|uniref:Uncharacterized protein n=1 Tax=Clavelina lepadiformis TaxID=159417 RepID=A0ABP0G8U2_CLALP
MLNDRWFLSICLLEVGYSRIHFAVRAYKHSRADADGPLSTLFIIIHDIISEMHAVFTSYTYSLHQTDAKTLTGLNRVKTRWRITTQKGHNRSMKTFKEGNWSSRGDYSTLALIKFLI